NHPDGEDRGRGRLTFAEGEQPIVVRIWGGKTEHCKKMSMDLAAVGSKGIVSNLGCTVASVARYGRGSGLMRRAEGAAELIQAVKAGCILVSVKTRLGYSKVNEWFEWLKHVLKQGIANLSIHLRTRSEMSKYDAHWELIPEIKKLRDEIAPNTLLTINGDIPNRQVGIELVEKYGVDGVMIGRGVFTNPFAFEVEAKDHSPKELLDLSRLHLDLFDENQRIENRPFKSLRRFFKIYVRGIKGAADLRHRLMETDSTDEVRAMLDAFEAQMETEI